MSIYRRVLAYYRPFVAPTVLATLLTLVSIGFNLLKPWPFAVMVDKVLPLAMGGSAAWSSATSSERSR